MQYAYALNIYIQQCNYCDIFDLFHKMYAFIFFMRVAHVHRISKSSIIYRTSAFPNLPQSICTQNRFFEIVLKRQCLIQIDTCHNVHKLSLYSSSILIMKLGTHVYYTMHIFRQLMNLGTHSVMYNTMSQNAKK